MDKPSSDAQGQKDWKPKELHHVYYSKIKGLGRKLAKRP